MKDKKTLEPTIEERVDIWRYAYSRASLIGAGETASLLLKIQDDVSECHRKALLTAFVIMYARPFTMAQITDKTRVIPMVGVPVPTEFADLHKSHMEMRNKVFGHTDATGPTIGNGVINEICFNVEGDDMGVQTFCPGYYAPEQLKETTLLTDQLSACLEARIVCLIQKYPLPLRGDGRYFLNLSDLTKPWIEKRERIASSAPVKPA